MLVLLLMQYTYECIYESGNYDTSKTVLIKTVENFQMFSLLHIESAWPCRIFMATDACL